MHKGLYSAHKKLYIVKCLDGVIRFLEGDKKYDVSFYNGQKTQMVDIRGTEHQRVCCSGKIIYFMGSNSNSASSHHLGDYFPKTA